MRIFLILFLGTLALNTCAACAQDLQDPNNQVQVVEASVVTTKTDGPVMVSVIGELRNTTNSKVDELVVEAKLTDSKGKVIDVVSGPVYGLVVPAGQQVAFRLLAPAAVDQSAYSGVKARVIGGNANTPSPPRKANQKSSVYLDMLISWAPLIFLLLIWIYAARKYSGKGSLQAKMLAALCEQNELLAKHITAIETIASVASAQKRSDG